MSIVYADRVKESTATTGTGPYTLGGAKTRFRTFAAANLAGDSVCYRCVDTLGGFETAIGTVSADATTVSRDVILSSSAGGSPDLDPVNWTETDKDIAVIFSGHRMPGMHHILTQVADDDAQIDFTLRQHYPRYIVRFDGVNPVSNGIFKLRLSLGGSFLTSTYHYGGVRMPDNAVADTVSSQAANHIPITGFSITQTNNRSAAGIVMVNGASSTQGGSPLEDLWPMVYVAGGAFGASGPVHIYHAGGANLGTAGDVDGLRFFFSTGNILSARLSLYGVIS